MDLDFAIEQRAQVEEFQRKHHIGLLALLFTDVVGSTALKQQLGDREAIALIQRHHAIVRETLSGFNESQEIGTAGDSFFIVFAKPSDAVKFALQLQAQLRVLAQETGQPVLDRIGIHVGEVFIADHGREGESLYGIQVDTCSRVMGLGHADQILMTRFAFDSARQVLRGEEIEGIGALTWANHGPYLLKGVEEPLEICEVGELNVAALSPPASSEKAHRYVTTESEPVLGWRPALDQRVPNTKWILEQKLGEGGFGEVWLGRHEMLKQTSVFKFCFRADRVRALKREVTLFRLLKGRVGSHENIVGIQDVYFDDAPFYIMMDYAGESNLRAWCDAQGGVAQVPLSLRLEIVAQVADALQAAHDAGVIHRDIKPSNILVKSTDDAPTHAPQGDSTIPLHVRLTDFGIGQVVSKDALEGITQIGFTQTLVSTGSDSQLGTQVYMAPELLTGSPASPQSDIYSLGVVLYQLLAGDLTRPITTDWREDVADPLLREDLNRCFARDPTHRFASAQEFAAQMRSYDNRRAQWADSQAALGRREESMRRRRSMRTAAIAAGVILLIGGLIFYGWSEIHHANEERIRADEHSRQTAQLGRLVEQARSLIDEYKRKVGASQPLLLPNRILTPDQQATLKQLVGERDSISHDLAAKVGEVHQAQIQLATLAPLVAHTWKRYILTSRFWVGEKVHAENMTPHVASAWDPHWQDDFGGIDDPRPGKRKDFIPITFVPKLNPFYCALPYNDVTGGHTKPEASNLVPWFKQTFVRDGQSVCKDRWVAIRNPSTNRVAYAQWSDCGPAAEDQGQYVFGAAATAAGLGSGTGLNISPAICEYLNLGPIDLADWKFVDYSDVPVGPWSTYGENNDFVRTPRSNGQRSPSPIPLSSL